jgi:hypothetical protein
MICMVMFGNGVVTGMLRIIIVRVLALILRGHVMEANVFFAAVVGSLVRGALVLQFVARVCRTAGVTEEDFG